MLAVRDDGLVEGSVSGGCIEDDIVGRVRQHGMTATHCDVVTYGVTADDARRFGLPCGGTIQLVLEPLTESSGIRCAARRNRGRTPRRTAPRARTGLAELAPLAPPTASRSTVRY